MSLEQTSLLGVGLFQKSLFSILAVGKEGVGSRGDSFPDWGGRSRQNPILLFEGKLTKGQPDPKTEERWSLLPPKGH